MRTLIPQFHKITRLTAFALGLILALSLIFPSISNAEPLYDNTPYYEGKTIDILFLHDTHSHLNTFATVENGARTMEGGYAGIKSIINREKANHPDTLVIDAGDFSMGTLVQSIFDTECAELRMLGAIDCDVSTLGNHEFDYRAEGLANALTAAKESGEPLPSLVLCNIDWETMEAEGLTDEQKLLKDAFETYGLKDYTVITKGDLKIGVFGIFGTDALACAPTCVLKFRDAVEAATETVAKMKIRDNVDLVVCISHSGTNTDAKKSEDEILAEKVPEIDFIVSGHSHTIINEPIIHGDTCIGSCGEYGKNIGKITLSQLPTGRWTYESYELIPVTDSLPQDSETQQKIDQFLELVDTSYLSQFGYTRTQVLAQNDVIFSTSPDLYNLHTDHNLGNLLSDAFYYTVNRVDTGDSHPVDVSIIPSGCVRDTFAVGDITVEDVFNAYSLGIGPDKVPGYPLLSFYLTGAELKTGVEIDASISPLMPSARLYIKGMDFTFNPNRIILNKVTDSYLEDSSGNHLVLKNDQLYRVVCDLYSGQMLGAVTDMSYGLLKVIPKFADGTPITNLEDAIIYTDGKELKAWAAIASYLESLPDTDGDSIANIPAIYHTPQDRKIVDNNKNLIALLKSPNKYSITIFAVGLGILILLGLLIKRIIKLMIKRLRRQRSVD